MQWTVYRRQFSGGGSVVLEVQCAEHYSCLRVCWTVLSEGFVSFPYHITVTVQKQIVGQTESSVSQSNFHGCNNLRYDIFLLSCSALVSAFEKVKKKNLTKIRKIELQMAAMAERHSSQVRTLTVGVFCTCEGVFS